MEEKAEGAMFWSDRMAKDIVGRKSFHYIEKPIPKFDEYVVKTSASLSGVLHIGRLSDTIRGETVHRSLLDAGHKSKLIWVAEDMDPLRKVPAGVPANYEQYIGMPVTDIPDPDGCHDSYAAHHVEKYFEVIDEFVKTPMQKFSMRAEYKKGNFTEYVQKILKHIKTVVEIQNKHREEPLPPTWSPWTPICDKCGKISTAKVLKFEHGKVHYKCEDYAFEKTVAKGCGHEGINDPLKANGKMMWKSEWASQWARWKVVSEGAGKEYQVPNSAFWINAEIAERVLDFPMPEPIFYEHIMIDNVKMSASLGNVVYPKDWLLAAPPELLRFFYNKKLMKTRSFSWKDLPILYDDYDSHAKVHFGEIKVENEKEKMHMSRLYEISQLKEVQKPVEMSFAHAAMIAQLFEKKEDIIASLEKTGHYRKDSEALLFDRIEKAKLWVEKYAPDSSKFKIQQSVPEGLKLTDSQKNALHEVAGKLNEKEWAEQELFNQFYEIIKKNGLSPNDFFKASYMVLLNKERGPKLAAFILAIGHKKVASLFEKV